MTRTMLVLLAFVLAGSHATAAQEQAATRSCDVPLKEVPRLTLLGIRTGRLASGQSICLEIPLNLGEFVRISIDADSAYLRARLLGPQRNPLQVTLIWSFFPSLPLAAEAAKSGSHFVELSAPATLPPTQSLTYRVQLVDWVSAKDRAARQEMLRRDARVAWLEEHARTVRSIAPADTNFADLEFLRDVLQGARVVLLGEGDHGGGSDVLAHTRLTKFLHERMGFDVVAFEAGLHSTSVAWRALQTDMPPREALLKGVFGILARSAQAEDMIRYLSAHARMSRPLEVTGFDSQLTGTAATSLLPELQDFLRRRAVGSVLTDSQAVATRVLAGIMDRSFARDRSTLPSAAEQSQTVQTLRQAALDIEDRASDPDAQFWAQVLRSTATQVGLLLDNLRSGDNRNYTSGRDRQMAENLNWLVNTKYAGRKVVVWAHTSHVMRSPEATSHGKIAGYTMGEGVWRALGKESFAIGFTSYTGTTHWLTVPDEYDQDLIPEQHAAFDFETLMDAAGHEIAFVDLRAARQRGDWIGGRFVASALYLMPEEAEWSRALDAFLFIRTQQPRRTIK